MKFSPLNCIIFNLILFATNGCYVIEQSLHHNDLFNTRRPVDEVLADPKVDPQTKNRLRHVNEVMAFARGEGLNTEGAYTYFIGTPTPVVSYLVQAAFVDQLKFKTWWFPVVGSVPYLGFFSEPDRDQLALELDSQGYDVKKGTVGAFSSLGWFPDPIFYSMIQRGETSVSHLFLHELTHRTLWVPDSVQFNENLAEYVASVLTVKFLSSSGRTSQIPAYHRRWQDKITYKHWLDGLKKELEDLYKNPHHDSKRQVLMGKSKIFNRHLSKPLRPKFTDVDYIGGEPWNNATLLSASLYAPDIDKFASAFKCLGPSAQIKNFLAKLKALTDQGASGFEALEQFCQNQKRAFPS